MYTLIWALVFTHATIISVTLYLHRSQAHRGVIFNPILVHAMRFWLWLTTGMQTKQWVAVHRKHHRFTDKAGDPHSPHVFGIWQVLFLGASLYHKASQDHAMLAQYGVGTPDDCIERNLYSKYPSLGLVLMLLIDVVLFQWWGILVWLIQLVWIPFWAAGVVNGLGHWFGYRNNKTQDSSTNIVPIGIIIGGEELHNNHHKNPANPKLSQYWWEFDIGWMWLRIFERLGLARLLYK